MDTLWLPLLRNLRRGAVLVCMALAAAVVAPGAHAQAPVVKAGGPAAAASAAPRPLRADTPEPGTPAPGATQGRWKWRDASGRINVSDLPPPREIPEKDILERRLPAGRDSPGAARMAPANPAAATGASAPASPRPSADADLERRRRAEQAREAQPRAAQEDPQLAARKRDNCSRARAQLAALESGQRMARVNEKGERTVLDDRARAEEARRAREIIAADCG